MPIILGRLSPSTSIVTVLATVATMTPQPSPKREIIITVARAAKAVFTRLFPKRMVGITFSGWPTIRATLSAPAALLSTKCLILTFRRERKAASEKE